MDFNVREFGKFIDMVIYLHWNYFSFGIVLKKNIHIYLKKLLKYSFLSQCISLWDQVFFLYFNQNNILQQIEYRSRYENSAVIRQTLKRFAKM